MRSACGRSCLPKGDTMGRRYAIVGGKLIDGTGAAPVDMCFVKQK